MELHQAYRLIKDTLAIHSVGTVRNPLILPTGAIVTLVAGPLDGVRMVDVSWHGKVVMMFTQDLRERGTPVDLEAVEEALNSA